MKDRDLNFTSGTNWSIMTMRAEERAKFVIYHSPADEKRSYLILRLEKHNTEFKEMLLTAARTAKIEDNFWLWFMCNPLIVEILKNSYPRLFSYLCERFDMLKVILEGDFKVIISMAKKNMHIVLPYERRRELHKLAVAHGINKKAADEFYLSRDSWLSDISTKLLKVTEKIKIIPGYLTSTKDVAKEGEYVLLVHQTVSGRIGHSEDLIDGDLEHTYGIKIYPRRDIEEYESDSGLLVEKMRIQEISDKLSICHLPGQLEMGESSRHDILDSPEYRFDYFHDNLYAMTAELMKNPKKAKKTVVCFPYVIGCGSKGGDRDIYIRALEHHWSNMKSVFASFVFRRPPRLIW